MSIGAKWESYVWLDRNHEFTEVDNGSREFWRRSEFWDFA